MLATLKGFEDFFLRLKGVKEEYLYTTNFLAHKGKKPKVGYKNRASMITLYCYDTQSYVYLKPSDIVEVTPLSKVLQNGSE